VNPGLSPAHPVAGSAARPSARTRRDSKLLLEKQSTDSAAFVWALLQTLENKLVEKAKR